MYRLLFSLPNMTVVLLSLFLGVSAGTIAGSLGVSSATLILPGLLTLGLVKTYAQAIGTTLLILLLPLSMGSVYVYYLNNDINYWVAFIVFFSAGTAAYFGAKYRDNLWGGPTRLKRVTAVYYTILAIYFFWDSTKPPRAIPLPVDVLDD
tara:strand:- start:2404 stop:2853 length:450 start_codon:yes stop_codon:yes gene_type:complete